MIVRLLVDTDGWVQSVITQDRPAWMGAPAAPGEVLVTTLPPVPPEILFVDGGQVYVAHDEAVIRERLRRLTPRSARVDARARTLALTAASAVPLAAPEAVRERMRESLRG